MVTYEDVMFWMVTGMPLLPTLPALGWDPTGEGIGERGDGVPVVLESARKKITGQSPKPADYGLLVSGSAVQL